MTIFDTVLIVGGGLIGSSIARAARDRVVAGAAVDLIFARARLDDIRSFDRSGPDR